jgi:hypothetical protein
MRMPITINRSALESVLNPAYKTQNGEEVGKVLARHTGAVIASLKGGSPIPEGWTVFRDSAGTVSAHYHDGPSIDRRFAVPVITIWSTRPNEVEISSFTRYLPHECGWCGCDITGVDSYTCPACGGN